MAFGIEARVPYLDNNLIKAIKTLPDNMRIKGNIAKYILRKISEKYLPTEIINRPKIGFGVPINEWMKNKNFFGKYVSILEEERTLKRSIYNQVGLKKILFEFRNKNDKFVQSRTGLIWSLLNLEVWIRTFIEDKKPII
jgi:asparagine synthase (glutamine-hydrolysing)